MHCLASSICHFTSSNTFSNRDFKTHIKVMVQLMCSASKVMRECYNATECPESLAVQTLVHHIEHGHLSLRSWKTLSAGMSAKVHVTCADREYEQTLSGVVFYILNGFLPMVTTCCKELSAKNKPNPSSQALTLIHIQELESVAEGVVVSATL